MRDSLQEYAYDAELAGMSFSFDQQADGILLSLDGYNDKLGVLVNVITSRMRDYQVDEKRFHLIHDQVRGRTIMSFASIQCRVLNMVLVRSSSARTRTSASSNRILTSATTAHT